MSPPAITRAAITMAPNPAGNSNALTSAIQAVDIDVVEPTERVI